MTDKTLDLLLQEREIKKLLDEHLERTTRTVEAITSRFESRSKEILAVVDETKNNLTDTKISVATEIANAKKEIGELAVQRTLSVFTEARNVVIAIGALAIPVIVGSGLVGYNSLKSSTTAFVDAKVREWMSVSMPNSPVKATLEKLRNDAVVDALSIKLDRQTYGNQPALSRVELSADEKSRLCQVMLNPETSDSSFQDAARLIEASKGLFAGYDNDLQLSDVIKAVLQDGKYSERKRYIIFENLWRERALLGASLAVLDKKEIPDEWALYAFKNVARHTPGNAEPYAIRMLNSQELGNQRAAADYLATNDPLNPDLRKWLDGLRVKRDADYPVIAASLGATMVALSNALLPASGSPYPASNPAVQSAAAGVLYDAVRNGAVLRISRFGAEPETVEWEHAIKASTRLNPLDRPKAYFENDTLLTAVLSNGGNNVDMLSTLVSALEVGDGQNYLASIQVTLPTTGWLEVDGGTKLTPGTVVGGIRLTIVSGTLTAIWRAPNGQFISAKVLPGSNLSGAHYSYLADEPRLNQLDMHSYESAQL